MRKRRIFVVDDDPTMLEGLKHILTARGDCEVELFAKGREALKRLEGGSCDLVLTDLQMPDVGGIQILEGEIKRASGTKVIVMTGHGTIDHAVRAMQLGAYDFLTKPVEPDHLEVVLDKAFREMSLIDEVASLRQTLQGTHAFHNVLSQSPRMKQIFETIQMVAPTATTILIEGETGTGKEQVARAIHSASAEFRSGPMVAVHCAALPEQLFESELFGHEKGSFTGAAAQRRGRFEAADKGTLFLDEVSEIPLQMQVKLLRVLQERYVERVGGSAPIEIDVRVIAATNRRLTKMIRLGKFREDLYYRLNIMRIELPPLRDRREDIPLLAVHFTTKYTPAGQATRAISGPAMEKMLEHAWPGNIRELENSILRACIVCKGSEIQPEDLQLEVSGKPVQPSTSKPLDLNRPLLDLIRETTSDIEKRYITMALKKSRGHIGRCAKICGLSRRSISAKLAEYGIEKLDFKEE